MWSAVIAAVAVMAGVALGAFLEPLRLRYARRERLRQERLTQAARLVQAGNRTIAIWATIFRLLGLSKDKRGSIDSSRWEVLYENLQDQRNELYGAASLLTLYGPDDLANQAQAFADVDLELSRMSTDLANAMIGKATLMIGRATLMIGRATLKEPDLQEAVSEAESVRLRLTTALEAFVRAARDHSR